MTLAEDLRDAVLQCAVEGKLSSPNLSDTPVKVTLHELHKIKTDLIKSKIIKGGKLSASDETVPFNIPETWEWVKLFDIGELARGKSKHRPRNDEILYIGGTIPLVQTGDVASANKYITSYTTCYNEVGLAQSRLWKAGTLCITIAANIGDVAILGFDACFPDSVLGFQPFSHEVNIEYVYYMLLAYKRRMNAKATKVAQSNLSLEKINTLLFPFPPIEEQCRIVNRVGQLMAQIDEYEKMESELTSLKEAFPSDMRTAILQAAMQGKLTERQSGDTSPCVMIDSANKAISESLDGQRVKKKIIREIDDSTVPFELPEKWEWVRLGNVCVIARGGSPRPIASYITEDSNGINWIKIGDTEKNGKYIFSTAEKIKPEGASKSRYVHDGDFLLTNSMSFGRPYILRTEGCIHDGWLVISQPVPVFDQDYLYWLLSSQLAYMQFAEVASGGVVKNLNSDKVANAVFPVPPIEEQKRIVERLETLLPLCDELLSDT